MKRSKSTSSTSRQQLLRPMPLLNPSLKMTTDTVPAMSAPTSSRSRKSSPVATATGPPPFQLPRHSSAVNEEVEERVEISKTQPGTLRHHHEEQQQQQQQQQQQRQQRAQLSQRIDEPPSTSAMGSDEQSRRAGARADASAVVASGEGSSGRCSGRRGADGSNKQPWQRTMLQSSRASELSFDHLQQELGALEAAINRGKLAVARERTGMETQQQDISLQRNR